MDHFDVDAKTELPAPPAGWRYLDFLGGTRELRCFLVREDVPRNRFMAEHPELLDEALAPIYHHRGISIRQDASYAVPGFYILSLDGHVPALDDIDPPTYLRLTFLLRETRAAMRAELGIEHIHVHYEEKPTGSCNVHFWLLPAAERGTGRVRPITRLDIKAHVTSYRFSEERDTLRAHNVRMRQRFAAVRLRERDDELADLLAAAPLTAAPAR